MRWLVFATVVILLSGCGLPPIVTYASYAADIFSYLSTSKSVTDHGVSFALQKDCALFRVLDGPICIEETETEIAVRKPAREHETRTTIATSEDVSEPADRWVDLVVLNRHFPDIPQIHLHRNPCDRMSKIVKLISCIHESVPDPHPSSPTWESHL